MRYGPFVTKSEVFIGVLIKIFHMRYGSFVTKSDVFIGVLIKILGSFISLFYCNV